MGNCFPSRNNTRDDASVRIIPSENNKIVKEYVSLVEIPQYLDLINIWRKFIQSAYNTPGDSFVSNLSAWSSEVLKMESSYECIICLETIDPLEHIDQKNAKEQEKIYLLPCEYLNNVKKADYNLEMVKDPDFTSIEKIGKNHLYHSKCLLKWFECLSGTLPSHEKNRILAVDRFKCPYCQQSLMP